jgi:hypothetical protein
MIPADLSIDFILFAKSAMIIFSLPSFSNAALYPYLLKKCPRGRIHPSVKISLKQFFSHLAPRKDGTGSDLPETTILYHYQGRSWHTR